MDAGDANVPEAGGRVGVGRREGYRRLVFGWGAAPGDDDPAIGEGDDGRLSVEDDFATKDIDVETTRAGDVPRDDEVGEQDARSGSGERGHFRILSSFADERWNDCYER